MQLATFLTRFQALAESHYAVRSFRRGADPGDAGLGNAPLPVVFLEADALTSEVNAGVDVWNMAFQVLTRPDADGGVEWDLVQQTRAIADDLIEILRNDGVLKNGSPSGVVILGTGADAGFTGWRMEVTLLLERTSREGLSDRFDPSYAPPDPEGNTPPLPGLTAGQGLARVGNQVVARLGEGLVLDEQGRIASNGTGGPGGGVSEGFVTAAVGAEATARASADSAETMARTLADSLFSDLLTAEAAARSTADTATDAALAAEVNARVAADAALTATITALIGMAPSALDTLAEIAARILDDEASLAAVSAALAGKVDKVTGYSLSKNDFTDALLTKLNAIAAGATANSADAFLLDRANHGGSQAMSTITGLVAALAALGGKADPSLVSVRNLYQIAPGAGTATVGAVTTETTLASYKIPAGTLSAGKRLSMLALFSMTGAGGNRTLSIRIGNTATMTAAAFVRQVAVSSANLSYPVLADVFFDTATTGVGYNLAVLAPIGASGAARVLSAVDTAQDLWVYITGTKASAGDGITLLGASITAYL